MMGLMKNCALIERIRFRCWLACQGRNRSTRKGKWRFLCIACSDEEAASIAGLDEKTLDDAWTQIHNDFGLSVPTRGVSTYIFGIGFESEKLSTWFGGDRPLADRRGCWVPQLRAAVVWARPPNKMLRSLVHEWCHAAFDRNGVVHALPAAICEGYAMLMEDRYCSAGNDSRAAWARKGYKHACSYNCLYSYADLCRMTPYQVPQMTRYRSAVFYAQSLLLVSFIFTILPESDFCVLARLLQQKAGMAVNPGAAIAQACGLEGRDFEKRYKLYANNVAGVL